MIHPQPGDLREWSLPEEVSDAYVSHLTAEQKVIVRDKRTGKIKESWEPTSERRANHLLDAEIYVLAAAEMRRVYALKASIDGRPANRGRRVISQGVE